MSTARLLLLGGTGFVGRSLCERLVAQGGGMRITVADAAPGARQAVQFLPTVDPVECRRARRRAAGARWWPGATRWST